MSIENILSMVTENTNYESDSKENSIEIDFFDENAIEKEFPEFSK